jgi:molecular chaperone DnaJ
MFRMFSGGRSRGGASSGVGPRRGSDLEANLTLDFNDAILGVTTSVYLTSDARCETCSGSGARPGTNRKTCSQCGGRGQVDDNQGFFSFASPCAGCGGAGSTIETPCGVCRGTGIEKRNREVKVRVPAGVSDGSRIRLTGKGTPGRNGGPNGDLFIICRVGKSATFGRDGDNLTVNVPVTFAEAALGANIEVPTLSGDNVTLRIKAGTQSGSRHRVKGRGVETTKHHGDLIVTVNVVVPTSLTENERQAIENLASISKINPRDNTNNS